MWNKKGIAAKKKGIHSSSRCCNVPLLLFQWIWLHCHFPRLCSCKTFPADIFVPVCESLLSLHIFTSGCNIFASVRLIRGENGCNLGLYLPCNRDVLGLKCQAGVVERKIKTLIFARVWWCIGCSYWCQLLADAVNVGGRGGGGRRPGPSGNGKIRLGFDVA